MDILQTALDPSSSSGGSSELTDWVKDMYEEQYEDSQDWKRYSADVAETVWDYYTDSIEQANADTEEDRNLMLSTLAEYKAGIGSEWMETMLADERSRLSAEIKASLDSVVQQFAQMGQAASPYYLSELQRRLTADANQQLAVRQAELELEQAEQEKTYLQLMYETLAGTERETLELGDALSVMDLLGSAV